MSTPPPIEQVSDEDALKAVFGEDGPRNHTPRGAAFLWYEAVVAVGQPGALDDAHALSYNGADWGDYHETAAGMTGWTIMQNVESPRTGESDIAYVKLLRADTSGRAFGDLEIAPQDLQWMTVVEVAPSTWRVWGISPGGYRPSANRVKTGED